MKIGIHPRAKSFSERWIEYCQEKNIEFKLVDCYKNDILEQLADCDGLMWHWSHVDHKAALMARQLTFSLEKMGKKVFPNVNTAWHFDDKIGQKYLFNALDIPSVPTYIFYDKEEALNWARNVTFPKVFKLSGGAGSTNVSLIRTRNEAEKIIETAFGKGFPVTNRKVIFNERLERLVQNKTKKAFIDFIKGTVILIRPETSFEKQQGKDWGYVYFQEFAENNEFDTRLLVIGNACFAVRRYNRKGDFRASGSGIKGVEPELFDLKAVQIAFETSEKIGAQCIAYDFVIDAQKKPLIVEISYGSPPKWYDDCLGYFDRQLNWVPGKFRPTSFMVDDFVNSITK